MKHKMYAGDMRDTPDGIRKWMHIYPCAGQIEMCGSEPVPVWVEEDAEGDYYGWKYADGHISMIWPSMIQLQMCFPYGMQVAIDNKDGVDVRLKITRRDI